MKFEDFLAVNHRYCMDGGDPSRLTSRSSSKAQTFQYNSAIQLFNREVCPTFDSKRESRWRKNRKVGEHEREDELVGDHRFRP